MLLLQLLHFARQGADLELVADRDRDAFRAGGLDQKIVGAGAHRFHGGIDAALGGEHDHRQFGIGGAQLGQHLQAAHVGHHQIEQHQGDLLAARAVDQIQRGLAAGRGDHLHAAARVIAASSSRRCTGSSSTTRMVCAMSKLSRMLKTGPIVQLAGHR